MFRSKFRWMFSSLIFPLTFGIGFGIVAMRSFTVSPAEPTKVELASENGITIFTETIDESFYELAFVNEKRVFGVGSFAGLQRSDDGGGSWTTVDIDTLGWLVRYIDFVDDKTGWVGGDNVLLKTEDGGDTWRNVDVTVGMNDVYIDFIDHSTGYIVGSTGSCERGMVNCTYGTAILKTTNGGRTWREVYSDALKNNPFQIKAISSDVVFVIFNGSKVQRTTDGGRSWEIVYENHNTAHEISISPEGTVWLAGEGSLLKSDDQGFTWTRPKDLDPWFNDQEWKAISFAPDGRGVIASGGSCVATTQDNGANWSAYCSDKIKFGLMFDIAIKGDRILISSSSDTAHDSISQLAFPK